MDAAELTTKVDAIKVSLVSGVDSIVHYKLFPSYETNTAVTYGRDIDEVQRQLCKKVPVAGQKERSSALEQTTRPPHVAKSTKH